MSKTTFTLEFIALIGSLVYSWEYFGVVSDVPNPFFKKHCALIHMYYSVIIPRKILPIVV